MSQKKQTVLCKELVDSGRLYNPAGYTALHNEKAVHCYVLTGSDTLKKKAVDIVAQNEDCVHYELLTNCRQNLEDNIVRSETEPRDVTV